MSEEVGWDPNWWRAKRAASLARKAAAVSRDAEALAGDSFLIVTEGEVTEPTYFDGLRSRLQLPAIKVVIEPGDDSDARHVIETAARLAQEQKQRARKDRLAVDEPARFDQVWAVLDTDVPERHQRWPDIQALATARGVKLAWSTPCFEYWLLLHVKHTTATLGDGTAAKHALAAEVEGYSTEQEAAGKAIKLLLERWPTAVTRAGQVRAYHVAGATPPPPNPSTEVDRLVKALNYSAPQHARRWPEA